MPRSKTERLYREGIESVEGLPLSAIRAEMLGKLESAANRDSLPAIEYLAFLYHHPFSGIRSAQLAERYGRRGAQEKSRYCQSILGSELLRKKKHKEAIAILQEAAFRGSTEAMESLACAFSKGCEKFRDLDRAAYWLERAIVGGSRSARVKLRWLRMDQRCPWWPKRIFFCTGAGIGFLAWHTFQNGFEFSPAFFAVYGGVFATMILLGSLGMILSKRGDSNTHQNKSEQSDRDSEGLLALVLRSPLSLARIPAEDGLFMLPLVYVGINPLSASLAALAFGFMHYPQKSLKGCLFVATFAFLAALLVLPSGIWTVVAGHLIADIVILTVLFVSHQDRIGLLRHYGWLHKPGHPEQAARLAFPSQKSI